MIYPTLAFINIWLSDFSISQKFTSAEPQGDYSVPFHSKHGQKETGR
jgi:hypothetical protein